MGAYNQGASPVGAVPVDPTGAPIPQATVNANGARSVQNVVPASIATGQVAVGTSATLVAAARATRQAITIVSASAVVFYVGNTGVTAANGQYVAAAAGASITINTTAAIYAVGASAVTVSYMETY